MKCPICNKGNLNSSNSFQCKICGKQIIASMNFVTELERKMKRLETINNRLITLNDNAIDLIEKLWEKIEWLKRKENH